MALGDAAQPQEVRSHRVVLDAYASIKGWLIATALWAGVVLLVVAAGYGVPTSRDGTDAGHVWGHFRGAHPRILQLSRSDRPLHNRYTGTRRDI